MNWREFFASIVGSVAWPTAVVLLLILFRTAVKDAIKTLLDKASGQVEILGIKANWEALVSQTEANIRGEPEPLTPETERRGPLPEPALPLKITDEPMIEFAQQMIAINQDLKRALQIKQIDDTPYRTMETLAEAAARTGAIPWEVHQALVGISSLLEMLVHIPPHDRVDATRKLLQLTRALRASVTASLKVLETSTDEHAQ